MTAETHTPTIAEQLRAEAAPNRNVGLLDPALLAAAADELDRARLIVDAVVARHQHQSSYPVNDHGDLAYAAASAAWFAADLNLTRAITRAAEHYLDGAAT